MKCFQLNPTKIFNDKFMIICWFFYKYDCLIYLVSSYLQNIGYTQSSQPVPSIFSYASDLESLWSKYLLNHGGNFSSQIQGAASAQNGEGQALFALSSNEGSVLLIKMPPLNIQGMQQGKIHKDILSHISCNVQ